jgi:CRISPR-associated protein Csd1
MILQALNEYYLRRPSLPREGWIYKEIPFLAVIDDDGNFIRFEDTREGGGKNGRAHSYLVPSLGEKKGSGIKANLFWENVEYMFGIPARSKAKPNPTRVEKQHIAFKTRIEALEGNCNCLSAVRLFVNKNSVARVQQDPLWETILLENPTVLLALEGKGPVTDNRLIQNIVSESESPSGTVGVCLISGLVDEIVRLEPPIKGVAGPDRKAERSLVSVNNEVANGVNKGQTPAFGSYLKEKGCNSPIGKKCSFAYTTALNSLLSRDSRQRMLVGDATTVFWAEKPCNLETEIVDIFGEPPEDNPDRGTNAVKGLFTSVQTGIFTADSEPNRFYVLGLAPNAARISVRFWIVDTVAGMADKIVQHFEDLRIARGPRNKEILPLWRLLACTAVQDKSENVPPNLAGDTMRAILNGLLYPQTLLQAVVRRIRVEHDVTYARASLIKACINRRTRFDNPQIKEELNVSLDTRNTNIGYRLGRLFAALEKIQAEANPGINATIRDRFYGAASGTPVTVFSNLMRLKNHHLAKLDRPGRRTYFEKLIAEIMDSVEDFPAHLSLADQGRFAIGYYHQTRQFWTKKELIPAETDTQIEGGTRNV